jgi:benzoylformate decarboxylase/acetolactate synthase-1/2/3 large subunit
VEVLASAEAPLIAAGGEVGQLYATSELVALAELLGAGVVTEWRTPTYLPMPTDHPLYLGDVMQAISAEGVDLFREADTILSVGFEFTEARVGQYPFQKGQRIIHVSSSERDIGKQVPADVALLGHPRPTLNGLCDRLDETDIGDLSARRERVQEYAEGIEADLDTRLDRLEQGERPTTAEETIATLRKVFGEKLLLVSYPVMAGAYVNALKFEGPDDYYGISGKASAQGWAAPAGIGVQLAEPDRDVVVLNGDGGFLFTSPVAMYTAAYYDMPVTVITLNNRGWGGGNYASQLQDEWNEDFLIGAFDDPPIDFEGLSRGIGVRYNRIDAPEEAERVLRAARDHGGPSIVEVPMDFGDAP